MNTVETLDGVTFELSLMHAGSGLPTQGRLALRRDGVTLYRGTSYVCWAYPWAQVGGALHDSTNVWLVGPSAGFLASVDALHTRPVDLELMASEIQRFQTNYGGDSLGSAPKVDPRILFLRQEARARNTGQ